MTKLGNQHVTKTPLNQQQQRRIKRNKQQHAKQPPNGTVITRLGNRVDVEDNHGQLHRCQLRRNIGEPVAGDKVVWQQPDGGEAVVAAICERQSLLGRPDKQGNIRPVAANIDTLLIVVAVEPELQLSLLDSYLVVAEYFQLQAVIIINKCDLKGSSKLAKQLSTYRQLGYSVLELSALSAGGLHSLQQQLAQHSAVMVGQSGVGKSSLVNALLPKEAVRVGELSTQQRLGRHTTTTATLYHLPTGGDLIDSPGIREFGLWHLPANEIAQGFVEFRPWLGQCKFRDCVHDQEPNCALREAEQAGKVASSRLASFHKLRTSY